MSAAINDGWGQEYVPRNILVNFQEKNGKSKNKMELEVISSRIPKTLETVLLLLCDVILVTHF